MKLKKIPKQLADYWYSVKDQFHYGYYHVFCWVLVAHCVHPGKCNLKALCRWIPEKIVYKQLVRLLQSNRWNFMRIFYWHVNQVWRKLPPADDNTIFQIIDKTLIEKTGKKHPYNRKVNTGYGVRWHFGFYVTILVVHWGPYRFPVDFRLVTPKNHPQHQTPNELFREMFDNFIPPDWCKKVVVLGDSGFAAKANLQKILRKGAEYKSSGIEYFFIFSFPRTWKLDGEVNASGKAKSLKDIVQYLPRCHYKKTWFTNDRNKRRVYWTFTRKACLNGVGDVTIILSKKRRNSSPKKAKIFVTNIPATKAADILKAYSRRWYTEVLNHELKSACGLGHHQVTKKAPRVERSVAISMITYLTIFRFEADKIKPGEHWSINTLKHFFTIRIFQSQSEQKKLTKPKKNVA